jgi:hypothetical protein
MIINAVISAIAPSDLCVWGFFENAMIIASTTNIATIIIIYGYLLHHCRVVMMVEMTCKGFYHVMFEDNGFNVLILGSFDYYFLSVLDGFSICDSFAMMSTLSVCGLNITLPLSTMSVSSPLSTFSSTSSSYGFTASSKNE